MSSGLHQAVHPDVMEFRQLKVNKQVMMVMSFIFVVVPFLAAVSWAVWAASHGDTSWIILLVLLSPASAVLVIPYGTTEEFLQARKDEKVLHNKILWNQHIEEYNQMQQILRSSGLS